METETSKILVVEDDKPVRNLIATTLKMHGYSYLEAVNGTEALMMTSSYNPSILLLDLGLPDMDGTEVIRQVRSWSQAPILVISARSDDTDKIGALDAGADDYITKPFSVEELLARLRVTFRRLNYLQNIAGAESSVYVNAGLKIDYAAHTVFLKEEELHLTQTEYRLLCLLAVPSCEKHRQSAYLQVHYPEHLGEQLGEQHGHTSRSCDDPSEKTQQPGE